ncbi:MAG: nucleic acid binding OB-fold tRNA/helicase-type [Ilumatobacteraceae bacterium]|nr:nucleic acid binding OB-fold tRNA/helicase-type [Ilumatobacteraceae bacterium]
MGIRDLAKRLKADSSVLDSERLQHRFQGFGLTPIGELACRTKARVGGEVKRMSVTPRQGVPSFEVVVGDGTGDAVAVFTGRRSIAGVEHGRAMVIEGVAREERGRRIMLNPAYTLIEG